MEAECSEVLHLLILLLGLAPLLTPLDLIRCFMYPHPQPLMRQWVLAACWALRFLGPAGSTPGGAWGERWTGRDQAMRWTGHGRAQSLR